jgi:DNA-binding IclR family transcriptional regulator
MQSISIWGGERMVPKITMILDILSDGKWHETEELLLRLELNEQKLQEVTTFLNNYDFVKVDRKSGKVKINKDFQKLLAQANT